MSGLPKLAILLTAFAAWPASAADPQDWNNVRQLQAGQKIEVIRSDGKRTQGRFAAAGDDEVRVRDGNSEVVIARQQVFRISSLEQSRRMRNLLLGMAIGAGAGLAVGAATDSSFSEEGEYLAKTIFTPVGAGAGAALGASFAGFETIYRRPK